MSEDAIRTICTVVAHRDHVRLGLLDIIHELERRSLAHDLSKLSADEFDGFTRINRAAREHPYGSEEYKAGLAQEKPTILLHYSRNSHHPEHFGVDAADMSFLDIIEMVCDWRAAWIAYGSQGSWFDNMELQRQRYLASGRLSEEQWWLVEQVSDWLAKLHADRE